MEEEGADGWRPLHDVCDEGDEERVDVKSENDEGADVNE